MRLEPLRFEHRDLLQRLRAITVPVSEYSFPNLYLFRAVHAYYEALALCGGIYYADDEPAGFVIGEELNDETFVLHFAKARTRFKGVYQYLYNNFAKVLPPKYRYLNLEQDLNKENLRVFKSSYVPDVMVKKARVSVRART